MGAISGIGDWIRVVIGFGSLTIVFLMIVRLLAVWRHYSVSQRLVFLAIFFYEANYLARVTELIFYHDERFNWWLLLILAGHTCMVIFLWEPRSKQEKRYGTDLKNPPTL